MNPAIPNHLWQSTVFAATIALVALGFRKNSARVRYWLWWSASLKFLVPFTVLITAASHIDVAPASKLRPPEPASAIIFELSEPFSPPPQLPAAPVQDQLPAIAFAVWAIGVLWFATRRTQDYLRVRAALRSAAPLQIDAPIEVRCTAARLEPGIVGWRRPVLLLPAGIVQHVTPTQFESILAHEICHARRCDNLTAAVHMIVETLFWFHPLVWWIGARLLEERERACDEAVLAAGREPGDYAEAILKVCRFCVESPLACVSGVTGADVNKRLHAILTGEAARNLSTVQKFALVFIACAIAAAPFLAGIVSTPAARAQAAPAATAKFEVASIRPCSVGNGSNGRKSDTKTGGGGPKTSPGRLVTGCDTVEGLIRSAYVLYAIGRLNRDPSNPPVEGGPSWIRSDRYQIIAKAEGATDAGTMNGPLLRALLEDRFQVKVHREAREVPVYALTVAKSGSRLTPFQPGSCTPVEFGTIPRDQAENPCRVLIRNRGPNLALESKGATLRELTKLLYLIVDRPVLDRTEMQGRFDIDVTFAPEQGAAAFRPPGEPAAPPDSAEEPTAPRIFEVFEKQLGLKLEPARGPREYLVIDRVEHPSKN